MKAILTYHSIDPSGSPISMDRAAFECHVAYLASDAVRVVPLGEIAAVRDESPVVAITFDDGFKNFADIAWPLLRDAGLPATVFLVAGRMGMTNRWSDHEPAGIPELPLMDWDAARRIGREGCDLGAHGLVHRRLRGLDDGAVREEVEGAAERIERETGRRPGAFCFPYGVWDRRSVAAVRQGFTIGCTTEMRLLTGDDDPILLPRVDAFYLRGTGRIETLGHPRFARLVRWRRWLRRIRGLGAGVLQSSDRGG